MFPILDMGMVTRIIEENQNIASLNSVHSSGSVQSQSIHTNKLDPLGQSLSGDTDLLVTNSASGTELGIFLRTKFLTLKRHFPQ